MKKYLFIICCACSFSNASLNEIASSYSPIKTTFVFLSLLVGVTTCNDSVAWPKKPTCIPIENTIDTCTKSHFTYIEQIYETITTARKESEKKTLSELQELTKLIEQFNQEYEKKLLTMMNLMTFKATDQKNKNNR